MIEHIREFFELKSIAKDAKEIPSDIGVLMVVQPEGLSPETAYAIDQFALGGGKVLAFVDPVPEMQRQGEPHDDDDAGAARPHRVRQAAQGLGRRLRYQQGRGRHLPRAARAVRRRRLQRHGVRPVAGPRPPQSRRARCAGRRHRAPEFRQRRLPGQGADATTQFTPSSAPLATPCRSPPRASP